MSETGITRNMAMLRVFSLVLSLLALAGWGTLAYADKSSTAAQRQPCEQVGELKIRLGQVMAERDEARAQLAAAQEEIAALTKRLEDHKPKSQRRGGAGP